MAKTIASLTDGRVVPWFSEEDPVPAGFVDIPPKLLAKYMAGEITDGVALAKSALAGDVGAPADSASVAAPPKAKRRGSAQQSGEGAEPSFPSVTHLPIDGTMRA